MDHWPRPKALLHRDNSTTAIEGLQQIAVLETLLAVGMIMGLAIGTAAFVVSATDRAVERRAQVTAITLIGARARTMRAVQCVQRSCSP